MSTEKESKPGPFMTLATGLPNVLNFKSKGLKSNVCQKERSYEQKINKRRRSKIVGCLINYRIYFKIGRL